jgi:ATP-dependent protease ClpP protease subunit
VARADYLLLNDGRMLEGEVVEATNREVRFRCQVSGIWTTLTFSSGEVASLEREEGDQSDLGAAPAPGAPEPPSPKPAAPGGAVVAVVPLHGQVGGLVDDRATGTFDAAVLDECFEQAQKDGAQCVILDVDSPGGLVSEMEAICETIIAWHDRLRIVAFDRSAYSAAAIISLSCRELAMTPDGRIGAAVIIKGAPGGHVNAVDAKFASPHYAKQRQYMAASGKPYEVVAAMTIQETSLWWSGEEGFTTTAPTGKEGWKLIDGATTVLTLTAAEAREYHLADVLAADVDALVPGLGMAGEVTVVSYDDRVQRYNKTFDVQMQRFERQLTNYFEGLRDMVSGLNAYAQAARDGNRRAAQDAKRDVNRARSTVLVASRSLRHSNRSLLSRRVTVAEDAIRRFEEDAALIGRISDLIASDKIDGFKEAADRMNAVLEEWRHLLNK